MTARPYTLEAEGPCLAVRVTPRARRTEATGLVETPDQRSALAIRLAAPPVEGAANQALVDYLARELGLGKSSVRILAGDKSRLKRVLLSGLPPPRLDEWLSGRANP